MNVSLTDELERRVDERVRSGLYTSASELIREALRLFFQFEDTRRQQVEELNRRLAVGIAQLDRGEGVPASKARSETLKRRDRRIRTAR